MPTLYNVDSPINREQRNNLNATFTDILRRFSKLELDISFLAGGESVDEVLQRIQDAIDRADTNVQTALDTIDTKLAELENVIVTGNDAIQEVNAAKDATIQATQMLLDVLENYIDTGEYSMFVQYKENNTVTFNGSTYRAKRDNLASPPPSTLGESNEDWILVARRGTDAASDSVQIWRGATQPTDVSLIWFRDPDLPVGQLINIYSGVAAPTDSNDLWLKERGI